MFLTEMIPTELYLTSVIVSLVLMEAGEVLHISSIQLWKILSKYHKKLKCYSLWYREFLFLAGEIKILRWKPQVFLLEISRQGCISLNNLILSFWDQECGLEGWTNLLDYLYSISSFVKFILRTPFHPRNTTYVRAKSVVQDNRNTVLLISASSDI